MTRVWRWLLFGAIASLGGVLERAVAQTLEPDLSLPGAEARLGWGSGFVSGAWSELRLTVTGGGAYRLDLETADGTLRAGLKALTARLEVTAGAGVRERRLLIPLFFKHPVKLTLSGAIGKRSLRLEPFTTVPEVTEAVSSPAVYLGGARLSGNLDSGAALNAVAGGARLPTSSAQRLPLGALGLGAVQSEAGWLEAGTGAALPLTNLVAALTPEAQVPGRRSEALALWSVAAFIGVLGLYSARRLNWRFSFAAAGLAVTVGAVGFVSLQPKSAFSERRQTVLVGAGGWGLKLEVHSRFNPRGGPQRLPVSAQPLEPMARQYTSEATLINVRPWSRFAYLEPPRAAIVPMRVSNDWIENLGDTPLKNVYVVGHGSLEPLSQTRRRLTAPSSSSFAPAEYEAAARVLPVGSAIAQQGDLIVIALPEGAP